MPKPLVIVESPAKAKTIAGFLGSGLRRRVEHRPHPRPAPQGPGGARRLQGRAVGQALGRRRRQRLQAPLRRPGGEEGAGHEAEGAPQGRRRGLSRHRRGSGGRGDRLAPPGGALAPRAGPADGVPRDHPGRHPGGRRPLAGPRPQARRRPGDPPDPRPARRLGHLRGAVEEGLAPAVRRPGAERRHPAGGRAGAEPGWPSAPPATGTWRAPSRPRA